MRRRIATLVAVAGAALLLAGCSGSSGSVSGVEAERGIPEGWDDRELGMEGEPMVDWVTEGERFAVVTWGSSSCPPTAKSVEVESGSALKVVFGPPEAEICTADFAPSHFVFDLPEGVTERPVSVTIEIEWQNGEVERADGVLE